MITKIRVGGRVAMRETADLVYWGSIPHLPSEILLRLS